MFIQIQLSKMNVKQFIITCLNNKDVLTKINTVTTIHYQHFQTVIGFLEIFEESS